MVFCLTGYSHVILELIFVVHVATCNDQMIKTPIIIIIVLVFSVSTAIAGESEEISYLLSFIASSGCTFVRNGNEYEALKAQGHLEYKYNRVKSYIGSAEEFIEKVASKSSLSKQPYEVRCDDNMMESETWLTEALTSYRKKQNRLQ